MSKNIKGITVELNGDTTGLTQALKKVDSETKKVQTELKQVERLLKLDPSNTELLAQKQQLLGKAIESTSTRLDALKQAQSEVERQFQSGEIGEEAYRKFQREIVATEGKLKSFQSQIEATELKINPPEIELTPVEKAVDALKDLQNESNRLSAEQNKLTSEFKLQSSQLGENASEVDKLDLAHKQLEQQMAATGKVVSNLEAQLEQAKTAFGENSKEVLELESKLNKAKASLVDTENALQDIAEKKINVIVNVDADTKEVSHLKGAMEALPDAASKAASATSSAITGIGTAAAAGAASIGGLVVGMQETNRDLAMLETQLEQVSLSVDDVSKATVMFASVSQETDQITEAMGNLIQAGYQTEEAIHGISQNIAGAIAKYGDTFNAEGLAESITTTTQLGEVTGQLMDLLEKEGIKVDDFNARIQGMSTEQERANYITQMLADQGLAKLYEAYATGNPAIIEQAEANQKLQQNLSDLSVALTPLVTGLTEFGNMLLDVALGNKTLEEAFEALSSKASSVFPEIISQGKEMFRSLVEGIEETTPELIDFIQENIPKMMDEIGNLLPEFLASGIDIVSSILEGLAEMLPDLIAEGAELVAELIEAIINKLPDVLDTGVEVVKSLIEGISNNLPQIVTTAVHLILKLATTILQNLPKITSAGTEILGALIKGIISLTGKLALAIATDIIPAIWKTITGTNWLSLGKDIVNGLIKGIGSMTAKAVEAITGVVNSVVKTAKKLLKINSPSKVFTEFGEWIGIGLANGMESTESLNEKIMQDLTNSILAIKEDSKNSLLKIDQELAKGIEDTNEKSEEKILKIKQAAAKKKRELTAQESKQIEKLRQEAADKITKLEEKAVTDRAKIAADEKKQIDEQYKGLLDSAQSFIDNKKSLNQLSLTDEATLWRETMLLFEEGTEQRIKAQQEYQKVTTEIQKQLADTTKTYSDEFQKIVDNQAKQEELLTKAYEDAVSKRAKSLYSFKDLFAEFSSEIEVTGEQLLANLNSQVTGFREWQREIQLLSNKGIDDGLLSELREMGPSALAELKALNRLTNQQLQKYSDIYKEKSQLARTQAESEFKDMKINTEKQIRELKSATNKELTQLEREWTEKIKGITQNTQTHLMTLTQIGTDASRGLLNGLMSMEPEIQAKAKVMADNISKTIKNALKVKSPSRVMMSIGHDVGKGLIIGMDDMIRKVQQSSSRLSNAVVSMQDSLSSSAAKSQTRQIVQQQIYNNQTMDMSGLMQAIVELAQRPIQTNVNMDGRTIARAVSGYQYSNASLNALTKGMSL